MKRQKSLPRLFKRPCPMFDTGGPLASHLHPPLSALPPPPLPPFKPRIASFPPGSTGQPSSAETLMILPIDCCSVLDGYRGEEIETNRSFTPTISANDPSNSRQFPSRRFGLMIAAYSRDACSITYLKKNLGIFGDKMDISQSAIKLLNRWINVIEKERENILKYEGDIGRDNLDEKLLSVAMSFDS